MSTQPVRVVEAAEPMSHREVLEALSGRTTIEHPDDGRSR